MISMFSNPTQKSKCIELRNIVGVEALKKNESWLRVVAINP